jgi:choline-sulfatase
VKSSFRRSATLVGGWWAGALSALCLGACNEASSQSTGGGAAKAAASAPGHDGASARAPTAASAPRAAASVSAAAAGPGARPTNKQNVLFITIDSLRADMPWTGYARDIAPNLTKLAKKSAVYTHAYSGSSYTAKSVATFLSGRYASTLYRSGFFFATYAKPNVFFTEALQDKGVRTLGGHAHMYFGRGKGLEQGFDVWELVPGIVFDPNTDNDVTSDKLVELVKAQLGKKENTENQFFAWYHFMDPHDKYQVHPECPDFGKKNRDRYDNEVCFTDLHLGKLFTWLEAQPWWKDTVLFISADHGEAFGENGAWKHAFDLWEVLTRIPLIVHGPGIAPRTIDERRSAVDWAPTVMELMGQPALPSFQGESFAAELYGAPPAKRAQIMTELAEDSHNPQVRALIVGDVKIKVWGDGPGWKSELYNLKDDPGEKTDLAKSQPEELVRMKALYDARVKAMPIVAPYGGNKLKGGKEANGPMGPT